MRMDQGAAAPWLDDYCFSQDGVFLIPIEQLAADGLESGFRRSLSERAGRGSAWIALFERAFALYCERTRELARQTPMYWFPPRVQHVCVVTAPALVRPYFQAFHKSAWRVLASDFDPQVSNVEFAAFQLVQAERLSILQDALPVLACNLSYWIGRTDEQVRLCTEACGAVTGPSAGFWRAFARALPWIRELCHEVLNPPRGAPAEPLVSIPRTGLILPKSRQRELERLLRAWTSSVEGSVRDYFARHAVRERNHTEELCTWLRDARPRVLITGKQNRVLWSAAQADQVDAVRSQCLGIPRTAAESLRADLELVSARSGSFLDSLLRPDDLPDPEPASADQNGLSYMHIERKEIAYNLHEGRMQRLREPAAPFERLMLGARTIHEWGHLATSAGWVGVAAPRRDEHAELLRETGALFSEILAAAPRAVRDACRPALQQLERSEPGQGAALARLSLTRVEDFESNLLAQRYCPAQEIETYVRNNVRSLVHDYGRDGMFQRLARYAYEYQYLRFSGTGAPRRFFMTGTWFAEQYFENGVVSEAHWERLLELLGRICDTYAVDERHFRPVHANG